MLLLGTVHEALLQMANSLKPERRREGGRQAGRTQLDNSRVKTSEVNCVI